jgi:hypothetical protein
VHGDAGLRAPLGLLGGLLPIMAAALRRVATRADLVTEGRMSPRSFACE